MPPVDFSETLYLGTDGEKTEIVKHSAMLYGRHANDKVDEYLLVGLDEYADTAFIHLLIGLESQSPLPGGHLTDAWRVGSMRL